MRREGGQTLFDALLIADVGQHFVKHRQAAAVRSRNHQAAHHHQSEQTHCLEQNCLTTGVGAGDHQGVKINAQGHIHRDDLLRVNERMPGPDQLDLPVTGDLRHRSLHLVCQTALGKVEIQLYQHLIAAADGLSIAAHRSGQLIEDAIDLLLLLAFQDLDLVIGFHHRHGLDEHGSAAGRGVMHQTLDLAAVLGLDRHHIPSVPHGDDGIL